MKNVSIGRNDLVSDMLILVESCILEWVTILESVLSLTSASHSDLSILNNLFASLRAFFWQNWWL